MISLSLSESNVKAISAFIILSLRNAPNLIGAMIGFFIIEIRPSINPSLLMITSLTTPPSRFLPMKLILAPCLSNGVNALIRCNTSSQVTVVSPITSTIGLKVICVPWRPFSSGSLVTLAVFGSPQWNSTRLPLPKI